MPPPVPALSGRESRAKKLTLKVVEMQETEVLMAQDKVRKHPASSASRESLPLTTQSFQGIFDKGPSGESPLHSAPTSRQIKSGQNPNSRKYKTFLGTNRSVGGACQHLGSGQAPSRRMYTSKWRVCAGK